MNTKTKKTSEKRVPHPPIVSPQVWRKERMRLLREEKAVTQQRDRVAAKRRRLPMVRIEKPYEFIGPNGKRSLLELFDGRRQLLVYHFMFDPKWTTGCQGCTGYIDGLGDLSMLAEKDTSFVLISRGPLAKLTAYQKKRGWTLPWYSSLGSDFNYDFHVTLDERVRPVEYNYRSKADMIARRVPNPTEGEEHGMSVFFRVGDDVFQTYSAFARGTEGLTDAYALLDLTPYGRQQEFEDSPKGWPQKPTYG